MLSWLPPTPLNSHLCSAGRRPGLISQPYTLASGAKARGRGAGATGPGTCQNTGPRGVKSSPQREGVRPCLPENSLTRAAPK